MPEHMIEDLASLDGRGYMDQIKSRLRDDEAWEVLLNPVLIERTRWGLNRLIESITEQKVRAEERGTVGAAWLKGVNSLQRLARGRLETLAPQEPVQRSSGREARAWRAFSARLARALDAGDPTALDRLQVPYGGLTAREWLAAREEKREAVR
jgi:hypothetical protein